jgi:xanthine dehydrogenase accessory factor
VRELLGDLDRWRAEAKRVAVARVVDVEGSGPREAGAAMAVSDSGEVAGSVSGGCVEGAVVEAALEALAKAERSLHTFSYSDTDAFAVGLTCGGTIHLFVEPYDPEQELAVELAAALRAEEPVALATVVTGANAGAKLLHRPGGAVVGTLGDPALDAVVARDAAGELAAGATRVRRYGERGENGRDEVWVFIESFVPPPRLVIFGAVDFTAALVRVARVLGFRVAVCDARPAFATRVRFPLADEVVVDWPHRYLERESAGLTARDAICVLTHDAKFDVPAIVAALETPVGYIGVMGSRRTHRDRLVRLREAGVDEQGVERLRAPIGLDLGARTPEETAVSICAEIIAVRAGRAAVLPLSSSDGPIHDPPADDRDALPLTSGRGA